MDLFARMAALIAALVAAYVPDVTIASDPAPVTLRYTVGRRGYDGLEAVNLIKQRPDQRQEYSGFHTGHFQNPQLHEFRTLFRFTGVEIPPGSKILSARIRLHPVGVAGRPRLAIHGLLKDWAVPVRRSEQPDARSTTWNDQYQGERRWGAAGAARPGDFDYDGDADHYFEADSKSGEVRMGKPVVLDVTRSFSDQFEQDKNYGWLIVETSQRQDAHANFGLDEPAQLSVKFIAPEGHTVTPPPAAEPQLIAFFLANPEDIRENMSRVDDLPFTGAVFFGKADSGTIGGPDVLQNSVFNPDRAELENYSQFVRDVRFIQQSPSKLQHNFLRINVVPGTLVQKDEPYTWDTRPRGHDMVTMWWDEGFDTVIHNWKVATQVAKDAGLKGILLDSEAYGGHLFNYERLQDALDAGKTIEETKQRVRERAEMMIRASNEIYPDMTIFLLPYLYDRPTYQDEILWLSFLDGLFAAADDRTRIVEGNSMAYYIDARQEFEQMYDRDYDRAPDISAVPAEYLRHLDVGFGLYIDRDGWGEDPELNASAASWQVRVEHAMAVTDSYVWVFQNHVQWWTGESSGIQAYIDATRRAVELARRRVQLLNVGESAVTVPGED